MGSKMTMEEWWEKWGPWVVLIVSQCMNGAVSILVKKVVDGGMNIFVFITYRQLVGSFFLAPIAFFLERRSRPRFTVGILSLLFVTAIVGASVSLYLYLLGMKYTTASFAVGFFNMLPAFTLLIALPFGMEKLNLRSSEGRIKLFGVMLSLGGAILLTVYKGTPIFNKHRQRQQQQQQQPHSATTITPHNYSSDGKKTKRWIIGSMALIAAQVLWSSWFILFIPINKRFPCKYSSNTIINLFGSFQSALICFAFNRDLSIWLITTKTQIFGILAVGLVGQGFALVGQSWCVKKRGPVFTAAFTPLIQIVAAILGVPLLHEQFFLGSLLGSITVVAGLYILLWGKTKEIENSKIKSAQEAEETMKKEQDPHPQSIVVAVDSDSRHDP